MTGDSIGKWIDSLSGGVDPRCGMTYWDGWMTVTKESDSVSEAFVN
jgi:hypothetical protein